MCGYGMTEASPTLTRSLDKPGEEPSAERRSTTGLPLVGVDVRVLGHDDVQVPWDATTVGDVCARPNPVMAGPLSALETTAPVLTVGWPHTGDRAVANRQNYATCMGLHCD